MGFGQCSPCVQFGSYHVPSPGDENKNSFTLFAPEYGVCVWLSLYSIYTYIIQFSFSALVGIQSLLYLKNLQHLWTYTLAFNRDFFCVFLSCMGWFPCTCWSLARIIRASAFDLSTGANHCFHISRPPVLAGFQANLEFQNFSSAFHLATFAICGGSEILRFCSMSGVRFYTSMVMALAILSKAEGVTWLPVNPGLWVMCRSCTVIIIVTCQRPDHSNEEEKLQNIFLRAARPTSNWTSLFIAAMVLVSSN